MLKKRLAQVFSCEFCKTSKNTFSYRTPPVAASVIYLLELSLQQISEEDSFTMLRLVLRQPSPRWTKFAIENIKIYRDQVEVVIQI